MLRMLIYSLQLQPTHNPCHLGWISILQWSKGKRVIGRFQQISNKSSISLKIHVFCHPHLQHAQRKHPNKLILCRFKLSQTAASRLLLLALQAIMALQIDFQFLEFKKMHKLQINLQPKSTNPNSNIPWVAAIISAVMVFWKFKLKWVRKQRRNQCIFEIKVLKLKGIQFIVLYLAVDAI